MYATQIPMFDPIQFVAALAILILGMVVLAGAVELARRGLHAIGPLFGVSDENWRPQPLADD